MSARKQPPRRDDDWQVYEGKTLADWLPGTIMLLAFVIFTIVSAIGAVI